MQNSKELVTRLEAAARRWWVPAGLADLLIRAAACIEVQAEMEALLRMKLERAQEIGRRAPAVTPPAG
jgi:hypothetical protein